MTINCPLTDTPIIKQSGFFCRQDVLIPEINIYFSTNKLPLKSCISLIDLRSLENNFNGLPEIPASSKLLSPDERQLYNNFSFKKRKLQWLGGRIAVKHAASRLIHPAAKNLLPYFTDISVIPSHSGKPKLSWQGIKANKLPSISLSHSKHLAVAIAAETKTCGIDVQIVTKQIHNIREKFTDHKEEMILKNNSQGLNKTEQLTLLWAAKEAVKKGILHQQPTFFSGIQMQDLTKEQFYLIQFTVTTHKKYQIKVNALQLGDYMMAFTGGTQKNA